ncbi:Histone chaperone asf1 [Thoreauomyces humboldtii]|nr:Histone chaperone asf1 [Thoreauomyces humboldtii]
MVGPVPVGTSKFLLEAPAPDPRKIPDQDIIGVTVILLMCLYREREFLRVGYYINNDYADERLRDERAKELKPAKPDLAKMQRSILAEKPRVTRFSIPWDNDESAQMQTENGQENDENAMEMDVGQEASGIAAGSPEKGMTGMSREGGPVQTMST